MFSNDISGVNSYWTTLHIQDRCQYKKQSSFPTSLNQQFIKSTYGLTPWARYVLFVLVKMVSTYNIIYNNNNNNNNNNNIVMPMRPNEQ